MFNYIVRRNGQLVIFATPPDIQHYQQALDRYKRLFSVQDTLVAIIRASEVEIAQNFHRIRITIE